jgi:hypothetical protein
MAKVKLKFNDLCVLINKAKNNEVSIAAKVNYNYDFFLYVFNTQKHIYLDASKNCAIANQNETELAKVRENLYLSTNLEKYLVEEDYNYLKTNFAKLNTEDIIDISKHATDKFNLSKGRNS